jgi:hypothetical protein
VCSSEGEQGHVVQGGVARARHLRSGDLYDEHLGQELDLGRDQVAGVRRGGVFFEANRDVDMRGDPITVTSDRPASQSLDVRHVHRRPYRCLRVRELLAEYQLSRNASSMTLTVLPCGGVTYGSQDGFLYARLHRGHGPPLCSDLYFCASA